MSTLEETLLLGPEAPIVLLDRQRQDRRDGGDARRNDSASRISDAVAPGNPSLGVMLPYTPLHRLLLDELGFPIVATSGNLSDEPICTDNLEALDRLRALADAFLVHDRPIARHVDDSVVRVVLGRELVLRRARGYAPLPVALDGTVASVLGVGAHLKSTVALAAGSNVFVSQHIGDLETAEAFAAFERVIASLEGLYRRQPDLIACDVHPDYLSSAYARRWGGPRLEVQHHVAHVLACLAENEVKGRALGVAWDGTGYGLDGTIWGGEFFVVDRDVAERVATFRAFALPGGDQAVKEPRRSALGVLTALRTMPGAAKKGDSGALAVPPGWSAAFAPQELSVLGRMIERGVNAPFTSSVGRLFDAVASLTGVRQRCRYEGQAATELEYAAAAHPGEAPYPIEIRAFDDGRDAGPAPAVNDGPALPAVRPRWVIDWASMIRALIEDVERGTPPGAMAARFHHALVEAVVGVARLAGEPHVVLSGGCFQNRYLVERTVVRLRDEGFRPYWHQRIPPNDGGISLGQVVAAARGIGRRVG